MEPPRPPVNPKRSVLRRLIHDPRGATAVEYGLIATLIVVAVIASIAALGGTTSGIWNNTNSKFGAVTPR